MSEIKYKPFIQKIKDIPDIFDSNFNVSESKYQNLPLLSLGFTSFTKQVREKMNDNQLQERLFYLVVNQFEHKINDYDKDLEFMTNSFFKLNIEDTPSRSFYKLWEILFYFGLISSDKKDFSSSHLAESDGSFLQSVIQYRNKFFNSSDIKNDKYCVITKNNKVNEIISECINKWKSSIFKHKTVNDESMLKDETGNDGDLTNIKTINSYISTTTKDNNEMDLVTSDGDFDTNNEEDIYKLLVGEIITTASIQKKGGNAVFKIYDIYTNITIKLICILKSFYKDVYLCKPLTSRNFKSERFLVCKDFKFSKGNKLTTMLNKLVNILEEMNKIESKNNYIVDIFTDYDLDDNLIKDIITYNLFLSNKQHVAINNIVEYKNSGNYFGDIYHKYRDMQILANNWWIETFYPENKDLNKYEKNILNIMKSSVEEITL
jgi:23S rRNA U2552 (ribose-2'-O)-methylase RlmE/FtsJ